MGQKWNNNEVGAEQKALLLKIAVVALVYFLAARLGLSLAISTDQVTTIWPPSGIALASLLIFGYRLWPGILIGAFAANAAASEPMMTAAGIAISNTATGLVGAYLLKEKLGFRNNLDRIRDVLGLVIAGAFLSPLISSTFGVLNLAASNIIPWKEFTYLWMVWWTGDMTGILIVAPLVLVWANQEYREFIKSKRLEAGLFFGLLFAAASLIFLREQPAFTSPFAYLILPFIIWSSFRLRLIGAATVNFLIAIIAVLGTLAHRGPFTANPFLEVNLIHLLIYFLVFGITSLLTAAAIEERKSAEQQSHHRFYHDLLTGLPNRFYFFEETNRVLSHASDQHSYALLKMDLDRFKTINESMGYESGDQVIKLVSKRVRKTLGKEVFFARLDGDEFIGFLRETKNDERAIRAAQGILDCFKLPFAVGEQEIYLTASVGISSFPGNGLDASGLLNAAKIAVYQAKELGRNNYQFYSNSLARTTFHQLTLENALRSALKNNELEVYYEPQIDLNSGRILKNEALVRWNHPSMGLLRPGEFIELAEITGLIDEIGDFVLEQAISQTSAWQQDGLKVGVAVNLSSRQFHRRNLVELVGRLLAEYHLKPQFLELELTERTLLNKAESVQKTMEELKKIGVSLSIDDFNTGYSSMAYIQHFPIDVIKIGHEFVKGIPDSQKDSAIAKSIIELGHDLGKMVTAEGVETTAQLSFFEKLKCDRVQGYYFGKPMNADNCLKHMKSFSYKFQYNRENSRA